MSGQNPYAPPQAELDPGLRANVPDQLPNAGRGARFLNFVIDSILSRVVAIAVAAILIRVIRPDEYRQAVVFTIVLALFIGYYVLLEAAFGWTLAKLITGTRVVRIDGRKPTVGQAIGRTLARCIPFEPFSVLFSDSKLGWHDTLSNTRVVSIRR